MINTPPDEKQCPPYDERAGDEAAHWLVALEDAPDDSALRARFQAWLRASPANAHAWADTAHVYDLLASAPPEFTLPKDEVGVRRAVRRRRIMAAGGALALAASLALVFLPDLTLRLRADQMTDVAETRSLSLADGSTVHMGPDSALSVSLADGRRQVRLLRGEAFFEVAPDPARPFVVQAGGVNTTVLGTGFDVSLLEDGADVAVRHGKVRVEGGQVAKQLEAGDWVRMASGKGEVEHGHLPPAEVAPWQDGQIVARDRPMTEIARELGRYHHGMIVFADREFAERRVTGVYNVADPQTALQAVVGAHGGRVRPLTPWVFLVTADK